MMYVHAAHQRIGVATLLLAAVETAARAQRVEGLLTDASITGRPFFERRGFAVVSSQQVTVRGQSFGNFRMHKQTSKLTEQTAKVLEQNAQIISQLGRLTNPPH